MAKSKATDFELKWGYTVQELAEAEGVTTTSLNMRVMHYGTPFQRKVQPKEFEAATGRSLDEIALALDVAPTSLQQRFVAGKNIFVDAPNRKRMSHEAGTAKVKGKRNSFWLHPAHPDYVTERSKWYDYLHELTQQQVSARESYYREFNHLTNELAKTKRKLEGRLAIVDEYHTQWKDAITVRDDLVYSPAIRNAPEQIAIARRECNLARARYHKTTETIRKYRLEVTSLEWKLKNLHYTLVPTWAWEL